MQTTLLGLAIAFIIALVAALIGPYFIDWNQFRPQFEAEAARVVGAPVRVVGKLDARLLPTPSLRLRYVTLGGTNDLGKVRADKLDVEFSLGSLMRGEWRADKLTIDGLSIDLGLDSQGRIDWPASTGRFNLGTLAIDRLNLTGRIAFHDAASRGTLELNDIAFSGDVRSLAGAVRGDGSLTLAGTRYPFRVSSGQSPDGNGTRVHLNVDPGARALSADLEGVLSFETRAPRFDGAMILTAPAGTRARGAEALQAPWRISARVKADPAAARLEQIEASYGAEDTALKFTGAADLRFGGSPLLHAVLSARQLDADRFAAKDNKDNGAAEPVRLLPALRAFMAAIPQPPVPTQIEFSSEQIMLGGRPLQDVAADLKADATSWTIDRLDFRAPGATRIGLGGTGMQVASSGSFKGALSLESPDPDALMAWLQGRSEITHRSQKPLRVSGDVSLTSNRAGIDAMKAEIDGGEVEGRMAFSDLPAGGSRFEAELSAARLDLDAATAFARSLAGPQAEWPGEGRLSLNVAHAISAGQELRPFAARFGYDPKTISLDRLNIGGPDGVAVEGAGKFERIDATGWLALNSSAASFGGITGLIAPFAPALASRLNAVNVSPGAARLKLMLDLGKNAEHADRASARASLDLDAPQLKGTAAITAQPLLAELRGMDIDALRRSEVGIESRLSSARGDPLLVLLGLDGVISAGEGPLEFQGSVTGAWRAPLRLQVKMSGTGLDAEAQGTAEPWAPDAKASVSLKVRRANLAPLFALKPSDALAQNISFASRVSLAGTKLTFDDLDTAMPGSRLRGRLALTLDEQRSVEGEIGLETLDLAPAIALAIGAAGHDAAEPLGSGLVKGWRGRIAFQALRGMLPGGGELRPVSGVVKSDGQSLVLDTIKGGIGGGEATANIDAKQTANGIALNARLQLSGVDGAVLRYRALAMPPGRTSLQMTLASQGRSASALTGALSGSGTVTLESARIAGLDPRAFYAAIRASDNGQATDDVRLRQIIEPYLSVGALQVPSAQIPFSIRDGRISVGATTLDAEGARAVVSGGYDIPADQADLRVAFMSTLVGSATSRPELQLMAVGTPDGLDRTIDIAALSSWLAVRAIDRETRRLDSIERGEPPPPLPASIPPDVDLPLLPLPEIPTASHAPSPRPHPKSRTGVRPPAAAPNAPVVSQQVTPLPPPIEVRPAPGALRPKPRPPLVLTPPAAVPARPAF